MRLAATGLGSDRYVLPVPSVTSRMKRLVAASILALFAVTACGSEPPDVQVQPVSMRLTDSSTGFGLKLLDQLLSDPKADNVFISPLSATILLSMVASATEGETRLHMLTALGLDPAVDPSGEIASTIKRLSQSDSNAQLELAQAVWAQKGLSLSPAYVQKLRDDYKAALGNVDFTSPAAVKTVNDWVDSATHHKIPSIVDSFDPSTVGFLVNATYFHALWSIEFNAAKQPGDFTSFSGANARVPMMRRDDNVVQLATPDYWAALLPYKGGRFSALVILPKGQLSPQGFSAFLTPSRWTQALDYLRKAVGPTFGARCTDQGFGDSGVSCDGTLVMPKLELEYKTQLNDALNAIGYPVPAGMAGFCDSCFLSLVIQKTYLKVDEKGTTAAAVTGGAVATALREPMVVNRPFALALIDNATGAPMFLGTIGNIS